MTIAISGVLVPREDAEFLVAAFDLFAQLLAEKHSKPTPKLVHVVEQLRRATRKCGVANGTDTSSNSSSADEADPVHALSYATVSTAEAARNLGVGTNAVRALAQRNPRKLGSVRVGGRWTHDLARVEHRAGRTTGR